MDKQFGDVDFRFAIAVCCDVSRIANIAIRIASLKRVFDLQANSCSLIMLFLQ